MRARHAALVTVRARYVSDGATSLPHGLHQPGGPRPTPSSCGAHSAWLSASQTYKRGSAPPPRSGVPNPTHASDLTFLLHAVLCRSNERLGSLPAAPNLDEPKGRGLFRWR